jgi:hypothetical protein
MRNSIGEGTMCQRERHIIKILLSYGLSNLDDINECFSDDDTLDGFIKIHKDNDSEILTEVCEQEVVELIELFD